MRKIPAIASTIPTYCQLIKESHHAPLFLCYWISYLKTFRICRVGKPSPFHSGSISSLFAFTLSIDVPQPFLSSSLQSDKEKLVEKKIGVAISTELRSGFRKHCFRELLVKLFLPEPQVSGKKRFGPSPCRFATHCDSTAREMALRRFSLIAGGRND